MSYKKKLEDVYRSIFYTMVDIFLDKIEKTYTRKEIGNNINMSRKDLNNLIQKRRDIQDPGFDILIKYIYKEIYNNFLDKIYDKMNNNKKNKIVSLKEKIDNSEEINIPRELALLFHQNINNQKKIMECFNDLENEVTNDPIPQNLIELIYNFYGLYDPYVQNHQGIGQANAYSITSNKLEFTPSVGRRNAYFITSNKLKKHREQGVELKGLLGDTIKIIKKKDRKKLALLFDNNKIYKNFTAPIMTVNTRKKILSRRPNNENIQYFGRNISYETAKKVKNFLNIDYKYTLIKQFSNNSSESTLSQGYIEVSILSDEHVFLSTVNIWDNKNRSVIQFIAAIATIKVEAMNNGNENYHINLIMSDLNIKANGMPILNMLKEIYNLYIKNTNNILTLECLKHNISFYTSLGFKYDEVRTTDPYFAYMIYDTRPRNAIQTQDIQRPTLRRNLSLTNPKKNIKSYQIPQDLKIEIYRVGLGEHIGKLITVNNIKINSDYEPM